MTLEPELYTLNESSHEVLYIPHGYANGIIAIEPNSVLMIFSDHSLEDCKDDNIRLDSNLWIDWNQHKINIQENKI